MAQINDHTRLFPKPWVYHSLFWIAYYIFGALISFSIHHIDDPRFYWQLLTLAPPDMALVYFYLFLLRRFLLTKRNIVLYIVLILVGISVLALAYDRDMGLVGQIAPRALAGQRRVIDDEDVQLHGNSWNGSVIRAIAPPPVPFSSTTLASCP